jgi:lipid A disaccharide synthetase
VPEFIQHRADPVAIADALVGLIKDPIKRQEMLEEFDLVSKRLGEGGASRVAAGEILAEI